MIKYAQSRAVTLIEMIIAITLVGIVAGILGSLMHQMTLTYVVAQNSNEISWQTRLALFRFERELGETTALISGSSPTKLRFASGQDGTTIEYKRYGTNLARNGVVIAQHVTALAFSELDQNFNSTSTLNQVRCINISMTLNFENQTSPLATTVCPRNLAWSN